mmetsp:Transcript_8572/g.27144  ORF Transcript_8572/g.27144 Transcript_8572/m.27144 type:complete len:319 (-) Transcript_8572:420-1376(-)
MWAVAASEFAKAPYSNGRDRRYEEVKAALRQRYGRDAISECTKPRLKALAAARGEETALHGVALAAEPPQFRPAWSRPPAGWQGAAAREGIDAAEVLEREEGAKVDAAEAAKRCSEEAAVHLVGRIIFSEGSAEARLVRRWESAVTAAARNPALPAERSQQLAFNGVAMLASRLVQAAVKQGKLDGAGASQVHRRATCLCGCVMLPRVHEPLLARFADAFRSEQRRLEQQQQWMRRLSPSALGVERLLEGSKAGAGVVLTPLRGALDELGAMGAEPCAHRYLSRMRAFVRTVAEFCERGGDPRVRAAVEMPQGTLRLC